MSKNKSMPTKRINKKKIGTFTYTPTYKLKRLGYSHKFGINGTEIEWVGFYKVDELSIANQPSHKELFKKIEELLKGTGISKVTFTFLNENL